MATQSTWRSKQGNTNSPRWGPNNSTANQSRSTNNSDTNVVATGTPTAPANTNAFPPLGAGKTKEDTKVLRELLLFVVMSLVGKIVEVTTRTGARYIGYLATTSSEKHENGIGVILGCAQQILSDDKVGPVQKTLIIKGTELDGISASEVQLESSMTDDRFDKGQFKTDFEISNSYTIMEQNRSLQKWSSDADSDLTLESSSGPSTNSLGGWDQFAANEAKFGIKSNYEETMYTTKLDKSGKDYKERERQADQLAKEIMSSTVNNTHIAEERNLNDAEGTAIGQSEEDKYGAVVRGTNAYVPPGARRAAAVAAAATATASATARMNGVSTTEADNNNNNSSNSSATPSIITTAAAPNVTASGQKSEAGPSDNKQQQNNKNKDATGEFRQFVTQEKEKMERKKAAMAKAEKENRLADLRNWSEGFKLNYPVPKDVTLVTQSQQPNNQLKVTEKPRDPSLQKSVSPKPVNEQKEILSNDNQGSASVTTSPTNGVGLRSSSIVTLTSENNNRQAPPHGSNSSKFAETKAMLAKMTIPAIPPFDPRKTRTRQDVGKETATNATAQSNENAKNEGLSTSRSTFKMSAKASSFKPFNPSASAFTPGASVNAIAPPHMHTSQEMTFGMSPSPVVKPDLPNNAFFGNRVIKKSSTPLHVQKEFNAFKTGNVPESPTVGPTWGFTGKPHRQLFHVIPSDESSSSNHTPQHVHASINQLTAGNVGGTGLPPGMHLPPPHMLGQQNVPPHLAMPPHQGHHGPPQPIPHHQAGQPHVQQQGQHLPGPPHLGHHNQANAMQHGNVGSGNQPMYMPYGPYRFQHGQQPMQHLGGGGGPYMTPQFAGQMPFSPPMPPTGAPGGMYSPQMQNLSSVAGGNGGNGGGGPNQPNIAGGPIHNNGPPSLRGVSNGPPHMQGKLPPHMYYQGQAGQSIPGMPFPQQFPGSAGPSPVIRHQQQQPHHQQHPHHHVSQPHQQQFQSPSLPSMQTHGGVGMQQPQQHPLPQSTSNATGQQQSATTPVSGNASEAGSTSAANQGA